MDPICHTLFGAAVASTGLERKTRFGRATLIIGANLPDVDVISYAWGDSAALAFRRGLTHGIPALIALPVLLAALMHWIGGRARARRGAPAADFKWLWVLASLSVISHPMLDFLNVYGVRWLMPFDSTWFYGDVLYIVDPWMWGMLAVALIAARATRGREPRRVLARPACIGLSLALVYVIAMAGGALAARRTLLASPSTSESSRFMVAPVAVDPFRRALVIDDGAHYRTGLVALLPTLRVELDERLIPKGESAETRRAAESREGRIFLGWARFPFFEVERQAAETTVYIIDARYTLERHVSFGAIGIPLAAAAPELGPAPPAAGAPEPAPLVAADAIAPGRSRVPVEPHSRIVDLSHAFDAETIFWPTEAGFALERGAEGFTEAGYYYAANRFRSAEHGGTHIDAPIHFFEGRWRVDEIPLERLVGPAVLVDVSDRCARNRDHRVDIEDFEAWEARHGRIPDGSIVLLRTGFGRYWPDREAYLGTAERGEGALAKLHFPGLHADAARWLIAHRRIHAVGLDSASVDHGPSTQFETHRALFEANVPAFENLASLEQLPATGFSVIALPMKIRGGSGGPLRAIAIVPDTDPHERAAGR